MDLDDRVVVISGAASGIGKACALAFAREGARLLLADLRQEAVDAVAEAIQGDGGRAVAVGVDVADARQVEAMIARALDAYGRVDAAVNSAGILSPYKPAADITDDEWDRQIAVNLSGIRHAMRFEIRAMLSTGAGSIVNISSGAGLRGVPGSAGYTAAKHGVVGITKAAALDYGRRGIRVNAICPGYIGTPIHQFRVAEGTADVRDIGSLAPIGRAGEADEIADAAVWLASDRSSYVLGIALPVDGGFSAR
jgi:NAD(P)-dependent dehydrogenase (short-subunit alcohol dehydrogenase family)